MNGMAKDYLGRIATAEEAPGAKAAAQLRKLNLPLVEFREASLDSALEYLRQLVAKASAGELKPTFQVEPGVDRSAVVTLRLNDVPFRDALQYLSQLAPVRFTIERQMISVSAVPQDEQ